MSGVQRIALPVMQQMGNVLYAKQDTSLEMGSAQVALASNIHWVGMQQSAQTAIRRARTVINRLGSALNAATQE